MSNKITIYTSNTCAYCGMVKQYLKMKGKNYSEINIEDDPARRQEMSEITGGQMNVPVTVVTKDDGSQNVTIGYNLGKLSSAIA
jgi:glutaredoxin